ncbi:class I SAM-dependent methyltransferase [Roseomonas sp. CECT 9278]|uniref:class I SAM-dependent methyltransferase n=1 Tax=Roseomonas sp. CECT 9278 TaxID=2845823 RepID=UPI001E545A73|nr:class I SAM-dependent methyltransferase [Roseomonas sp. CECT 9278]CAH0195335.1 Ubiquinone biosynthesis O-methyltransferase, mitochondrial [Roseomonas sp. CECT 9278]
MTPGICPITGAAATLVQEVSPALLRGLWRRAFKVEPTPLPDARIGVYRSPCGLVFFAPAFEGDGAFYESLYRRLDAGGRVRAAGRDRAEYPHAAARIRPGDAVLEVGAGAGAFARLVPGARYVGLDPNPGAYADRAADIRAEPLADHAAANPGAYDAAVAFQVIEHVADPLAFATDMLRCLKPGGLLVLGAPAWPSAMTAIPNFVFNAPPHHLSWWSEQAMRALADRLGLVVEETRPLPPVPAQPLIHWMGRMAPLKARPDGLWFAARRSWYGSLAVSFLLGRIAAALVPLPRNAPPMFVLLVARKP